jgi:hypothetical protein
MNIRRGLFRVWLIGAVIFASCMMALAIWSFQNAREELAYENSPANPYRDIGDLVDPPRPWLALGALSLYAFGVPVAVLVFGRLLLWAADGFRSEGAKRSDS